MSDKKRNNPGNLQKRSEQQAESWEENFARVEIKNPKLLLNTLGHVECHQKPMVKQLN